MKKFNEWKITTQEAAVIFGGKKEQWIERYHNGLLPGHIGRDGVIWVSFNACKNYRGR